MDIHRYVCLFFSLSLYVSECVLGLLPPPQASIMPCKLKFVVKTNAKYQDNQRTKVLIFFEVGVGTELEHHVVLIGILFATPFRHPKETYRIHGCSQFN